MTTRLESYRFKHVALGRELAKVGFIIDGSLIQLSTRCGKANCRCKDNPPQLHGPYWQWSAKVAGKTVSRRLPDDEADLYREWIANRRRIDDVLTEMKAVSAKAAEIQLRELRQK